MAITTTPPPIAGEPLDPPPKKTPRKIHELDQKANAVGTATGVGYRAYLRFSHAKATLLAAGTTYYMFLAMFSVIAFGYGITAWLGADQISEYLTEAIGEAFPGLLGEEGIDPATLRAVGQTTGIIGLIGLLYGGGGAVNAAKQSIHLVYGAPKDSRNFVVARLIGLMWLLVLAPLILLSFVASSFTADLAGRVFEVVGVDWSGPGFVLTVASLVLALGMNALVVYLALGNLGGIRPPRRARLIGAAAGAVVFELLKTLMTLLVGFTIDKPEYGALAAPIGILFVLFLLSVALYGCAALTAGIADRDVPLELLEADSVQDAQAAIEDATDEVEAIVDEQADQARG
jgi:membrane protein